MAWIESHQNLESHPKLIMLCQKTGWDIDEAIGKLHRLWWWALSYAEDGDLGKFDPLQYLGRLDKKINAQKLLDIFKSVRLLDEDGKIHDWLDFAGRYLKGKYRTSNPEKWHYIEKRYKNGNSPAIGSLKTDNLPTHLNLPTLTHQPKDDSPVLIKFPIVGKDVKEWGLTEKKINEYHETFPGVNIIQQAKVARQWCIDNPTRRKTFKGMSKFLFSWFSRCQNGGNRGFKKGQQRSGGEKNTKYDKFGR